MNQHLVACLTLSTATATGAASWALASGWGWTGVLAVYSGCGAVSLVGASLAGAVLASRLSPDRTRAEARSTFA